MSSILSNYVREQAGWREEKAEDHPDDQRNVQSAKALNSLADYLEHEDASVNQNVNFLCELDAGTGSFTPGEQGRYLVGRYGFGYAATSVAQHEALLDELSIAAMKDIYEEAADSGTDWSEQLFPCELEAAKRRVHLPDRYWDMRRHITEREIDEAIAGYSA